jgi:SAM-dependent methyltransferase
VIIRPKRIWRRIRQALEFELKPELGFIGSAIQRALRDRLAAEDSESKSAVVLGRSLWLAKVLGLKKTRILHLPYPDFTVENLALLSDEYDFVIADRVLHRCRSVEDAACETIRVLKPGGWFVHTASILDMASRSAAGRRTLTPAGLRALFPSTKGTSAAGWGLAAVSWVIGRKPENASPIAPSVVSRAARTRQYRYRPQSARFGVVAMARNEAPYLLEWIAYHRILGFQQITIYDNESNDASADILLPLSRAGIINARFWPSRNNKQNKAYRHAVRRMRSLVEWCLFVDLDEFLLLEPGLSLDDILPKEPDVSAVAFPWRVYGSGGLRNRDARLTIERFTMAGAQNSRMTKSIVRLKDVVQVEIHLPRKIKGRVVDSLGRTVANTHASGLSWIVDGGPARINHYFNRSREEFEFKLARGRGAFNGKFRSRKFRDQPFSGEVEAPEALRLVPAVREEVARLRKIIGER